MRENKQFFNNCSQRMRKISTRISEIWLGYLSNKEKNKSTKWKFKNNKTIKMITKKMSKRNPKNN